MKLDGGTLTGSPGILFSNGGTIIGTGVVNGDITGSGTIEGTGGTLTLNNDLTSSTLSLEVDSAAGSVLALGGTVTSSTSFTYLNTDGINSGTLLLYSGAVTSFGTNGVISGMYVGDGLTPTDILDVSTIPSTTIVSADISGTTIELWGSGQTELATFQLNAEPGGTTFVDECAMKLPRLDRIGHGADPIAAGNPVHRKQRLVIADCCIPDSVRRDRSASHPAPAPLSGVQMGRGRA